MRATKIFLFVSVAILVLVVLIGTERRSQAAPDLRWWIGNSTSGFMYDHVCKDGIVIWGQTRSEENDGSVGFSLYHEGPPQTTFEFLAGGAVQMVDGYGRWIIRWPYTLMPGGKITGGVSLPGPDGSFRFTTPIRDCYVPVDPQSESWSARFVCRVDEGSYTYEECNEENDGVYSYMTVNIPVKEDECRSFPIQYDKYGQTATHIDLSFQIVSAKPYSHTIRLKSPQTNSWVTLMDRQMLPINQLENSNFPHSDWVNEPWTTGPFILDDDSSFDLKNAMPLFLETAFRPTPDKLSKFIGEDPFGTWYLQICTHSLSTTAFEYSDPRFERATNTSIESGSIFKGAVLRVVSDSTAPTIFDLQGQPQVVGNQVLFKWKTDDKSTSTMRYGTFPGSYSFEKHDSSALTDHEMTLDNLSPGTNYYYVIEAMNQAGIITTSEERQFTLPSEQYALDIVINGQGTVQQNPNKPTYQSGETVTLTAVPASGYRFAGWSGDLSGTQNPAQVVMNGNKSIVASFVQVNTTEEYFTFVPGILK